MVQTANLNWFSRRISEISTVAQVKDIPGKKQNAS